MSLGPKGLECPGAFYPNINIFYSFFSSELSNFNSTENFFIREFKNFLIITCLGDGQKGKVVRQSRKAIIADDIRKICWNFHIRSWEKDFWAILIFFSSKKTFSFQFEIFSCCELFEKLKSFICGWRKWKWNEKIAK